MKFVLFYHSLVSDWNHGNAHFLRGIVTEHLDRAHDVEVYEPDNGWSVENLVRDHGEKPLDDFHNAFPHLISTRYALDTLDLDGALDGADVVIVHEWSDHELVRRIGEHRARTRNYRLFFHDTHHRAATQPEQMAQYDLRDYDGVLAYGQVIRDLYLERGWARAAWTWHEAADTRVFHPRPHDAEESEGDLVWIGNWGDEERTAELHEFLIDPAKDLQLRAKVYGVRYPDHAVESLHNANIDYAGWLANWRAPEVFSRYKFTVHVPRRPYVTTLRGIPTIRPFEAMACAIPLISAPWDDAEQLFTPGSDYLVARDGNEMRQQMRSVREDRALAQSLAQHGLQTIQARHTCGHRVNELLAILATFAPATAAASSTSA
ncbi:MAG: glycosyltransferase [Acidobacteriota bacterium]|nr:glycosyltransferase [Acidobacteriota bacterium]